MAYTRQAERTVMLPEYQKATREKAGLHFAWALQKVLSFAMWEVSICNQNATEQV